MTEGESNRTGQKVEIGFSPTFFKGLLKLGQNLNGATSREEAARIICEMADELFGWDACFVNLYLPEQDVVYPVVNVDTVSGRRTEVPFANLRRPPSPMGRRVLEKGPELILREVPAFTSGGLPFGDENRPSASIMNVPVRNGPKVVGVFSIQSYKAGAYTAADLEVLQSLADHCGGALERIRNMEALRESEERLRLASRAASLGHWTRDLIANETTWSSELERIVGVSAAGMGGKRDFFDFIHPDDRSRVEEVMDAAIAYRSEFEAEFRYLRPGGAVRWMIGRGRAMYDESGRAIRLAGIGMDITERKQVERREAALLRLGRRLNSATSREEAARIISEIADELFGWDAYFLNLYDTERACVVPIMNVDTIKGRRISVKPDMAGKVPDAFLRRVLEAGGELILRQRPAFSPDLRPYGDTDRPSASLMYVPIRDGEKALGVLSIQSYTAQAYTSEDLGTLQSLAEHCGGALERIRAAEALRENERELRTLSESLPVGVFRTNAEGLCLYNNQTLLRISGISLEECLDDQWKNSVHPDDREAVVADWWKTLRESREWRNEHRILTRAGEIRWVRALAKPIFNEHGKSLGYVGTVEDITDRRQADEALRAARDQLSRHALELERLVAERTIELEESVRSLESFCYSVAHDLRAPLRAMEGLTAVLLEDYGDRFDATGKDFAKRIVAAAGRMDRMIQDLLDYGRLSHADLSCEPVNLEDQAANALDTLADEISARNADICIGGPFPRVEANPTVLSQVLVNLIGNALKFVPDGARPIVRIHCEEREGMVRLWVEDNGIGIDKKHHHRIFRVFERLHLIENYPGTGIGLALVQKGIERMGGSVGVESDPGQGSRFWIELPLETPL